MSVEEARADLFEILPVHDTYEYAEAIDRLILEVRLAELEAIRPVLEHAIVKPEWRGFYRQRIEEAREKLKVPTGA